MKSICIYCGSADKIHPDYLLAGQEMGRALAGHGIELVFGGGKTGVMGAVAKGVIEAGGQATGVILEAMNTPALAHYGLTRLEVTPTMHERKARMSTLANGFIALPGGYGTLDELFEILTWGQIGIHQKPVGLLNVRGYFDPLLGMLDHATEEGFIFPEHRKMLYVAHTPEALLDAMQQHVHPYEAVQRWMRKD